MLKSIFAITCLAILPSLTAHADCGDANKDNASADTIKTTYAQTLSIKEGNERAQIVVKGMMCGNCAGKIESAVKTIPGVDAVAVHLREGSLEVSYDPKVVKVDALVKEVNKIDGGKYKASAAPAPGAPAKSKG